MTNISRDVTNQKNIFESRTFTLNYILEKSIICVATKKCNSIKTIKRLFSNPAVLAVVNNGIMSNRLVVRLDLLYIKLICLCETLFTPA